MSISRPCPYATDGEHCKYEIYDGEPILSKCKTCDRRKLKQSRKMTVDIIIALSSSSRTVKAGLKSFNTLFKKRKDIKEMLNVSDKEIETLTEAIEIMNKIDTTVNSRIDLAID